MSVISKLLLILLSVIFFQSCAIFEPDIVETPTAGKPLTNKQSASKVSKKEAGANSAVKGVKYEGYTIQVGAFKNSANADKVVGTLNKRGLDAFLYKDKSGIFKVRFGSYKTGDEAKSEALRLMNANIISDYYIVKPEDFSTYQVTTNTKDANYLRKAIVDVAFGYRGVPYTWGGESEGEGFDCSGLTRAVYRLNGLDIPRVSRDQFEAGNTVTKTSAEEGDLVFFSIKGKRIDHVGIYIGDNKFIHAPRKGKTVTVENLNNYWQQKIKGFRSYL